MTDTETVVNGLNDIGGFIAGRVGIEQARNFLRTIDDAIELLKDQDAVEQKWTSIKERYPEKEGFYLVSADYGNYHPWIAEMRIFKGIKGFCNVAAMPCVGAWMPLPEPYKEGQ